MKSILVFFVLCSHSLIAQNFPYKFIADKNLSLSFPDRPDTGSDGKVKYAALKYDIISYAVVINKTEALNVSNKSDYNENLKGFINGLNDNKKMKAFKHKIIDTILGGVEGKYVLSYNPSRNVGLVEMHAFVTLQDNFPYVVATYLMEKSPSSDSLNHEFFKRIKFSGIPYTQTSDNSFAYNAGALTGKLIILGLIIFGLIKLHKNNTARSKL